MFKCRQARLVSFVVELGAMPRRLAALQAAVGSVPQPATTTWDFVSRSAWTNPCRRFMPSGGALLVAEKLLDDDRTGPALALFQSLNMLVCTEGKGRTLGAYEALLCTAGFAQVEARRTESPLD